MQTDARILLSLIVIVALHGCRSSVDRSAVRTPPVQALPAVTSTLPVATAAPGADLSYDHRGGFGPIRFEHADFFFDDALVRCRRATTQTTSSELTTPLTQAQLELLRQEQQALADTSPRTVRRPARIHDLGVMTLSIGLDAPLIVDGAVTLDPYPEAFTRTLVSLKNTCLQSLPAQPVPASQPSVSP